MKHGDLWAGLDIGSLSAEAVIVDDKNILSYSIIKTGAESIQTAAKAMEEALKPLDSITLDSIRYIVATGYGRILVPFAQESITELSCHAKGANFLFPSVRTILDIGGQDCKVIHCDQEGKMTEFAMNDKCAAGTGRYLELIARSLGLRLEEIGPLSLRAESKTPISSRCAVFAKSETLSLNRAGIPKENILAGVHDAVAERVIELFSKGGSKKDLVMTGGVAKNQGLIKSLEEKLDMGKILLPEEPQIIGALGAALFAREKWLKRTASAPAKTH